VGNSSFTSSEAALTRIETSRERLVDLLSGQGIPMEDHRIHVSLTPGQCIVFEY
jgi:hypothetical protein